MDEPRFYQRPSFFIWSRLVFVLALYIYAVSSDWAKGTLSPLEIFFDAGTFIVLFFLWLAFFAQFVLPVQTFRERRKIFDRLNAYLFGMRGPALFIKNGQAIIRRGEEDRKGPGVIWLDSASGAVTHAYVSFKETYGPGVHFTDWNERLSEAVDLHTQVQRIGPQEKDHPFDLQGDTPYEVYSEVQKRRTSVSALTREGIEVVPDITVVFKIDADPIKGDWPGSHFGYDRTAVTRAVIGQAINPNAKPDTLEYKVAWNELPATIAADIWREYMSKFTLMQLFEPNLLQPAPISRPAEPPEAPASDALLSPVLPENPGCLAGALIGMLHELSTILGRTADRLESGRPQQPPPVPAAPSPNRPIEAGQRTALQVINFMLRERLTNPFTPNMDANGQRQPGWQASREYWALKMRGIRVLSVNVSNLRFPPQVEDQLVSSWTANWLVNARTERVRIETARSFAGLSGQEKALTDYATEISTELLKKKREEVGQYGTADEAARRKAAVAALLARSRMILVRNDRMHRRASNELEGLEEVMQWLEGDQA